MIQKFSAVDTLFFRSSAPFDSDLEHGTECLFPPLPSVYTGALRACTPIDYTDRHSLNKNLKIGLSGIMLDDEPLFPVPFDLRINNKSNIEKLYCPKLSKSNISSYPLSYLLDKKNTEKKSFVPEGAFLKKSDFMQYLNANEFKCELMTQEKYCTHEYRVGIGINDTTRTVENKKFYSTVQIRPKENVSLFVQTEGNTVSNGTIVKFGGESKHAIVNSIDESLNFNVELSDNEQFFKLYLATPAIFKNGWLPWWIKNDMTGIFTYKKRSVTIKLLCASIGRYIPVGGFGKHYAHNIDKEIEYPKKMNYAVPAGSVYYFKIESGKPQDVVKLFNEKCISDYREQCKNGFIYENYSKLRYCDRGFGYSLVGKLTDEQKTILRSECHE
jgi:CRISPR-associated protein Cmr3